MLFDLPPSCPPSLAPVCAIRNSRGSHHIDTMRALRPAGLALARQVSPFICLAFQTSSPQPRPGASTSLSRHAPRVELDLSGFAMYWQARRTIPPKRVRHPAGCSFASGCSPPRLATTQLPSASCVMTSHGVDLHLPDKATSRSHQYGRRRPIAPCSHRTFKLRHHPQKYVPTRSANPVTGDPASRRRRFTERAGKPAFGPTQHRQPRSRRGPEVEASKGAGEVRRCPATGPAASPFQQWGCGPASLWK